MSERVIIGSRGSALALVQTQLVIEKLSALFPKTEFVIVKIKTEGNRRLEKARERIGDKGVFTREIEEALLAGEIDLAVHSLKDLPTELPEGLIIEAILERSDPRDVLVSRGNLKLAQLPHHARLGTDSPRRKAQLLNHRRDLQMLSLRGNVETRLRKLNDGQYDAIVLAAAGLLRLGLEKRVTEYLTTDVMLPAPGQGALALETREDDRRTRGLVKQLDHAPTRAAIEAERAFLRRLGGGCRVPIAAYAQLAKGQLQIEGLVASDDGARLLRDRLSGNPALPQEAGNQLGERLLAQGADEILGAAGRNAI